ncbi:uncharacterized protein [Periplaneta americana]|uniref:uncharacterized protein n=1 Tax=Periplaneta americana TaxID=6978 RepID=UPI0037E9013D
MVADKCKENVANMTLEQRLSRWTRKSDSPFKQAQTQKDHPKWRDAEMKIALMKTSAITSETGAMIDQSIQLAKPGERGPAILMPSLDDVQEDFLKVVSEFGNPKNVTKSPKWRPLRKNSGLGHLDFMLNSTYEHGEHEIFPETVDIYFQPETVGTKRKLPLSDMQDQEQGGEILSSVEKEDPLCLEARSLRLLPHRTCRYILRSVPERGHPIRYGGLREHHSVHSVKLAISSCHMPQTKNGFSRKVDGSFYCV